MQSRKRSAVRVRMYRIVCVFVAVVLLGLQLTVLAANSNNNVAGNGGTIELAAGKSTVMKTPWPAVRVAVTDPKIADVKVLTPTQVLVQGIKVGSTDLIVWKEGEQEVQQWKVKVSVDLAEYKEQLDKLFPDRQLQLSQSADTLVVSGQLRNATQAEQLHNFLEKSGLNYADMTSVAGVQQVQLQVRVAEVSRTALRLLNINSVFIGNDATVGFLPSNNGGTPLLSGLSNRLQPGQTSLGFSPSVTTFATFPNTDFEIFLQALAENQYVRTLANPTLVALSGQDASFLAGGEFPVPVVQGAGASTSGTSITIQYKEFGVRLGFRPTVLGDGQIQLDVAPEVSELDFADGLVIQGFSVPALKSRKADTTLRLNSGQTFAMAGLMSHQTQAISSRIPGLGDLPVLGPLFTSKRYSESETELVIMVTASLVEPMSMATTPAMPGDLHIRPNDWEFYLGNRLEGKEPAKINPADAEMLSETGFDRLNGPGAWDSYGSEMPRSQADAQMKNGNG